MNIELPFYSSILTILAIFFVSLIVLHFLLVWPSNRSKRFWKAIDYVWVSFAFLGLIAAIATSRKTSAENLKPWAEGRVKAESSFATSAIRFGTSGAICRTFVKTQFSPPEPEFSRLEKGFNDQCDWFREVNPKLTDQIAKHETIQLEALGFPPATGGDPFAFRYLEETIGRYNEALSELERLTEVSRSTKTETGLAIVAPVLFAFAIALRLTKVTGEILHEKKA